MREFLNRFRTREAPSPATLAQAEAELGPLPASLRALLEHTDGLEADNDVQLYDVVALPERQETLEVRTYAPGHLAIGSDGGGRVVLLGPGDGQIRLTDAGDLDPEGATVLAENLMEWLRGGLQLPPDPEPPSLVDVYLERPPRELRSLVRIREELRLDASTAELLDAGRNPPRPLLTGVPAGLVAAQVRRLNAVDDCLGLRGARVPATHSMSTGREHPDWEPRGASMKKGRPTMGGIEQIRSWIGLGGLQGGGFLDGAPDAVLDRRDAPPFDAKWMRTYEAVEGLDVAMDAHALECLREEAYRSALSTTGNGEIAARVADDLELLARAFSAGYEDPWLRLLWECYQAGRFPS